MAHRFGVNVGGTFTDLVLIANARGWKKWGLRG